VKRNLKLIPIWLWVAVIIITVLLCSCRGGRSLGKGSAGTVIVPQTPQQINERNRQPPPKIVLPPLEPLAPIPVIPPKTTPVAPRVPSKAVRSTPTLPESNSIEANPVIINPKPAGELKPFSPTVSTTPVKLPPVKEQPSKLIEEGGVIITTPEKNTQTDDKATSPAPQAISASFINWGKLISYWLFVILMVVFGWIIYDTVMGFIKEKKLQNKENDRAKKAQEKLIKKPAKATRKSRKKAISKKGKK